MSRVGLAFEGLTPQNGTDVTVATGTSAAITSTEYRPAVQGVLVQALSTNSASIFVGVSGVTVDTGIELVAGGDRVNIPVSDPRKIYAISGTSSQKLRFLVV